MTSTLDELLMQFSDYDIYQLDADTIYELIVIVKPNGNVHITFEKADYPSNAYQVYDTNYDDVKFREVAHLWADTIIKLQGGNN